MGSRDPRNTFLLLLFCVSIPASAQVGGKKLNDEASPEAGRSIFNTHCAACHGKDARGGRAPALNSGNLRSGDSDAAVYRTISAGVPGTEMPAWAARINPADLWHVVAFLRSSRVEEQPGSGDARRGEMLFWGKGQCGSCHSVNGRGNLIGPDLSRAGARLSPQWVRQMIAKPFLTDRTGYRGVTVVMRDGTKITGIERALDDFSVVLIDFNGKLYSFDRTGVDSVEREKRPLMPEYGSRLSNAEMDDLLAYTGTLNGPPR